MRISATEHSSTNKELKTLKSDTPKYQNKLKPKGMV